MADLVEVCSVRFGWASLLLVAFSILRGLSYVPVVLALHDFVFNINFDA